MAKVVYQLAKSKNTKLENGGFKKTFPTTYTLPRIIRHTFQNESGDFVVEKLRYAPASGSILFRENREETGQEISFVYGYYTVDTNADPVLYKFMETIDLNGSKANRNKSKPILFYRIDNAKAARENIKKATTISQRTQKFFEMSPSEKEAIAVLWGIKTVGKDMDVWVYEVMNRVMQDPDKLQEIIDNNDLTKVGFIAKAQRFGLLEMTGRTWYFNSHLVVEVPVGIDPYTHLTSWINKNEIVFETWKTTILEREQLLTAAPAINAAAAKMTGAEALEKGMKYKVLTYDRGKGWRFVEDFEEMGDEPIFGRKGNSPSDANNKTNAANFIDNNHVVKKEIIKRIDLAQSRELNNE